MVKSARKRAFLAGASMQEIYADPFILSLPPPSERVAARLEEEMAAPNVFRGK